jgi:hypothetical protein
MFRRTLIAATISTLARSASADWVQVNAQNGTYTAITFNAVKMQSAPSTNCSATSSRCVTVIAAGKNEPATTPQPIFCLANWDVGTAGTPMSAPPAFACSYPTNLAGNTATVTCLGYGASAAFAVGSSDWSFSSSDFATWTMAHSNLGTQLGSPGLMTGFSSCSYYASGGVTHGFAGGAATIPGSPCGSSPVGVLAWFDSSATPAYQADGALYYLFQDCVETPQVLATTADAGSTFALTAGAIVGGTVTELKNDSFGTGPASTCGENPCSSSALAVDGGWSKVAIGAATLAALPDGTAAVAMGTGVGVQYVEGRTPPWQPIGSLDAGAYLAAALPSTKFGLAVGGSGGSPAVWASSYDEGASFETNTLIAPGVASGLLNAVDCLDEDTCVAVGNGGLVVALKNSAPDFADAGPPTFNVPPGSPTSLQINLIDTEGDPIYVDWTNAIPVFSQIVGDGGFPVLPADGGTPVSVLLTPSAAAGCATQGYVVPIALTDGRLVRDAGFTIVVSAPDAGVTGSLGVMGVPTSPLAQNQMATVTLDTSKLSAACGVTGVAWNTDPNCSMAVCGMVTPTGTMAMFDNTFTTPQCSNLKFAWDICAVTQGQCVPISSPPNPQVLFEGSPMIPQPNPSPNPALLTEGGPPVAVSATPTNLPADCQQAPTLLQVKFTPSGSPIGPCPVPMGSSTPNCTGQYNTTFDFVPPSFGGDGGLPCSPNPAVWNYQVEGVVGAAVSAPVAFTVKAGWTVVAPTIASPLAVTPGTNPIVANPGDTITVTASTPNVSACENLSFAWTTSNCDPALAAPTSNGATLTVTVGNICGSTSTHQCTYSVQATAGGMTSNVVSTTLNVIAGSKPPSLTIAGTPPPDAGITVSCNAPSTQYTLTSDPKGCPYLGQSLWSVTPAAAALTAVDGGQVTVGAVAGQFADFANSTEVDVALTACADGGECQNAAIPFPIGVDFQPMLTLDVVPDREFVGTGDLVQFSVGLNNTSSCSVAPVRLHIALDQLNSFGAPTVHGAALNGGSFAPASSLPTCSPTDGFDLPDALNPEGATTFAFAAQMLPTPVRTATVQAVACIGVHPVSNTQTPTGAVSPASAASPVPGLSCGCTAGHREAGYWGLVAFLAVTVRRRRAESQGRECDELSGLLGRALACVDSSVWPAECDDRERSGRGEDSGEHDSA